MLIGLDGLPLTEPKTGVGHYTFELAAALAAAQPSSQFEIVYPSTYPAIEGVATQASPAGNLRLTCVKVGPLGRHWWSVGLPRHLGNTRFDLFHGTNYDVPLRRRCATVLTIHDLSQLLHPDTHSKRSVARARRRLPLMVRTADVVITPTESVRREVSEHLKVKPEKVFAIPEAARACFRPLDFAETEVTRRKLGVSDDFLLTVGTLEPRKNLAVLVSAFESLMQEQPQRKTQLVIAGGQGWLSGPLFAAIQKSPLRDRILLTDYLHDEDLRALYSSCRAFIYPSLYEGFGLPPLEAMACGAPVVASRIAAVAETIADATLLFDPSSRQELGKHLLEVLTNEELRSRLAAAGRQRATEFSWEKTAELTWKVYEEALRKFRSHT
jgi:glycosyltransferase involved in cell wall biosynthesis